MPLKINFKTICIYACFAAAFVFSDCAVKGVPLALGLLFAALLCGTNVIVTPVLFALASVVNLNLLISLIQYSSADKNTFEESFIVYHGNRCWRVVYDR